MALKHGKPNPLNLLDLRRVRFPARHFHFTIIDRYNPNRSMSIDNWIYRNLNGRYYVGQTLILDHNNSITYMIKVGFENEKELSFFLLSYPEI